MIKLILIRHGQSLWNLENRFTGWTDIDLSENGINEAKQAGQILKSNHFTFDLGFTSVLCRSIHTMDYILSELNQPDLPRIAAWQLNERHYGALQGLNKAEIIQKYGEAQVQLWRRSAETRPPALDPSDSRFPGHDPKYTDLEPNQLPLTENLIDTANRVIPYWHSHVVPALQKSQKIIIVAHGNSLRALIQHLDSLSNEEIMQLEIPTGTPLCYELDENNNFSSLNHYYLQ